MSGFDKLEQSLKKKITLQDYKTEIQQEVKEVEPAKPQKVQKFKLTIYLTEEEMNMLNEICSLNLKKNWKQDKSATMSEALKMLYKYMMENK